MFGNKFLLLIGHKKNDIKNRLINLLHKISIMEKSIKGTRTEQNLLKSFSGYVEYKGVTVEIPRKTTHVTDNGWIGPDHPSTATEEWGKEMLETTANYIVDFMEEFKKVKLS